MRGAFGMLLVLVLTLGLGLAGSRHHISDPETTAAETNFLMAFGDLADLCGDLGQEPHPDCPLCHLVATAGLADPTTMLRDADLRLMAEIVLPALTHAARAPLDPASPAQGPPSA